MMKRQLRPSLIHLNAEQNLRGSVRVDGTCWNAFESWGAHRMAGAGGTCRNVLQSLAWSFPASATSISCATLQRPLNDALRSMVRHLCSPSIQQLNFAGI